MMLRWPIPGALAGWFEKVACLAILLGGWRGIARAADAHPEWTRLSPTEEIWVDFQGKKVVLGGRIAVDAGPIELFACPQGTKEHEAIVSIKASPRLVQTGLIALGLEPGAPATLAPEFKAASGPTVSVRVRWHDNDGRPREIDAREWIRDVRTGRAMEDRWVFAGGVFHSDPQSGAVTLIGDGADLICVSNFPEAMLDLSVESSSGNNQLLYEAFEGRVPPRGTPVEVVLTAGEH